MIRRTLIIAEAIVALAFVCWAFTARTEGPFILTWLLWLALGLMAAWAVAMIFVALSAQGPDSFERRRR